MTRNFTSIHRSVPWHRLPAEEHILIPWNRSDNGDPSGARINPSPRAFSLIEIVMALGIISFALVGIMGLFPVAMKSAQESQRETRAAQIAQQIFSDLHSMAPTNTFIAINTNILTSQLTVNLANASSNVISFAQDGRPLGEGTNAEAVYLAAITVAPNAPVAGLSRVQATIETPALATTSNRSKYTFVTLMNQR